MLHGPEWRTGLSVHAGDLAGGPLRLAGGGGLLLGETVCGREGNPVRLAGRQIRFVVADHAGAPDRTYPEPEGVSGDVEDGQDRYRRNREGCAIVSDVPRSQSETWYPACRHL